MNCVCVHVVLCMAGQNIKEMVYLFFVNHANNSATFSTSDWVKQISRGCFLWCFRDARFYRTFFLFLFLLLWSLLWTLQVFCCVYLTVHHKHCPKLMLVCVMPEENNIKYVVIISYKTMLFLMFLFPYQSRNCKGVGTSHLTYTGCTKNGDGFVAYPYF